VIRSCTDHGRQLTIVAAVAITLLASAVGRSDDESGALDLLAEWLTGSFSNAAQSAEDPEFFDVTLEIVRIWPLRTDGHWLYVEQAVREYRDRPYRQRVYRARELAPGLLQIAIFNLPDPTAAVGAWQLEAPLADLAPDNLTERDGCDILLRRRDESFVGSTLAQLCPSTLRGASLATSEVLVTPEGMVSWDRGFNAEGEQVWGSARGGYVFDRIIDDSEAVSEAPSGPESESEAETGTEAGTEAEPGAASGAGADGPHGSGSENSARENQDVPTATITGHS
jgi:hypothetical protein